MRHGTLAGAGEGVEHEGTRTSVGAATHAIRLKNLVGIESVLRTVGVGDAARAVADFVFDKVGSERRLAVAFDAEASAVRGVPVECSTVCATVGVALAFAVIFNGKDLTIAWRE